MKATKQEIHLTKIAWGNINSSYHMEEHSFTSN